MEGSEEGRREDVDRVNTGFFYQVDSLTAGSPSLRLFVYLYLISYRPMCSLEGTPPPDKGFAIIHELQANNSSRNP